MALRKTLEALRTELERLAQALLELHVNAKDEPGAGSALGDSFADAADDLQGWLAEGSDSLDGALGLPSHPLDLDATRLALATCHARALAVGGRLNELLDYESVSELARFSERPGDPRRGWAESMRETLERCRETLDGLHQGVLECWQELTERATAGAVSIQSTNIGQQLSAPGERVPEGMP